MNTSMEQATKSSEKNPVQGSCDPQFSHLQEAFTQNFENHHEIGAAIALIKDGELLVNLYGGYRDEHQTLPWQKSTRVNVWSTTKGVTALCFAMLVDRGIIRYESRLSEYWDTFDVDGKRHITVAMLLSHQAGLCGFRGPATVSDFYARNSAAERLAGMEPFWPPGEGSGYHPISVGILASELMVKLCGKSLQEFVKDELTVAFDLELSIGLESDNYASAAHMIAPQSLAPSDMVSDMDEIQRAALDNPVLHPELPNTHAWRAADIPSANGFATAEALATLYGALADDGCIGAERLIGREAIRAATRIQNAGSEDRVMKIPAPWACGFLRNAMQVYGPNDNAFGHSGWGGSFAFADPDRGIGFAYTMNKMGSDLIGDPRAVALVTALYKDLLIMSL